MDSPELADIVQIQQALQDNTGSSHHFALLSPERSLLPASSPHARWRRPMDGCAGIVSTSYLEGLGPSINIWLASRFFKQSSSAYPQDQISILRILPMVPHFFYDMTANSLRNSRSLDSSFAEICTDFFTRVQAVSQIYARSHTVRFRCFLTISQSY